MKRVWIFFLAAFAVAGAIWLAGRVMTAPRKLTEPEAVWPFALGRLRDVPKRYPPHEASTNATMLITLAAAVDVDLTEEAGGRRPPSHAREVPEELRTYLVEEVAKPGDVVAAPPPTVATWLRQKAEGFGALRAHLNANPSPRWTSDVQALFDPPRPNVMGSSDLMAFLAADALEHHRNGDDAAAWQDLDGVWKLAGGLFAEPDPYRELMGLYGMQLVTGVAIKLPAPPPPWWRGVVVFDAERSVAASMQFQAWRELERTRRFPAGDRDDDGNGREVVRGAEEVVFGPVRIAHAERAAAHARARANTLAATKSCGSAGTPGQRMDDNFAEMLWHRARRSVAEREGVTKLFALKEARRATGHWPATLPGLQHAWCPDHTWRYTVAADGSSASLTLEPSIPPAGNARLIVPLSLQVR